ncbi:hypothetical protein SAMN04487783_0485 [Agrococcus baldri]|uniref:Large exoprotein n=1 Tax=Agrococcus baldri TaxID=153730 RepID=A0AA94KYP1_9MICO|nr:hypothetical protein [Agrococcus baldri]SFS00779.1 hypothetical protein SAMN04487783_0485 [Agrococcus baldri]
MPEFAGLGTTLVLIIAVVLWVAYLVPVWTRKREYLATERNAIRLQQTLRIMAESAEAPEEVQLEADARTIAVQQKAVAKEARLKQAMEHAKAVARARELDEQIKAVEREVRAAVKSTVSRAQRLRRTRLACFALVVLGFAATVAGALVPGLQLLLAVGAAVAVLGMVGLVAVNSSSARMRRVAEATAPRVHDLVEAREVAAHAVATETRMAEQMVARQSRRAGSSTASSAASSDGTVLPTEEVLASRAWTPRSVPEQRLRVQYEPGRHASDDLLARAKAQLAEDRRAISGPIARVTRLEASFEEIIDGGEEASLTESERRMSPTEPALPIREVHRERAVAAAEALDVTRADAPIQAETDEHMIFARDERTPAARTPERTPAAAVAERAPAATGSRFAAMGLVDDDLGGMDVHEAFLRRVG